MTSGPATYIRLRRPDPGETGQPFFEVLEQRCGQKQRFDRMVAFIQEWDHLRDHDGAGIEPTIERFAEFWNTPLPTVFRMQAEFRTLFPPTLNPGSLVDLLWDCMANSERGKRPRWLLAVDVIDLHASDEFSPSGAESDA